MNEKRQGASNLNSDSDNENQLSASEWEQLIRAEEFAECPICGGEFVMVMGCRKICGCGYMEGCED